MALRGTSQVNPRMTVQDPRVQQISAERDPWKRQRALSKAVRRDFTDVLKDHGAQKADYAICTHITYVRTIGKSAQLLRTERGLKPKDHLRDHLSIAELAKVSFAEWLASDRIVEECCQDGNDCRSATTASARWVADCIQRDQADRRVRHQAPANDSRKAERAA